MKILNKMVITATILLTSVASHAAGLLVPKGQSQSLEIKEHHVEVIVEDGYAVTTVTQIFSNSTAQDMEAVYSFPVPKDGAVGEFSIWIDGKQVTGEVVEKKKAREIYENEKASGNNAGLTEQNSYKTFETSVYPVRGQQDTKIQLRYFQTAEIDFNVGRWVYQLEEGGVDEEALAFWDTSTKVSKAFSFNLILRSGYPVEAIRVPNHSQAQVTKINDNEWRVSILKTGNTSPKTKPKSDQTTLDMIKDYAKSRIKEATVDQVEKLANDALSVTGLTVEDLTGYSSKNSAPIGTEDSNKRAPQPQTTSSFSEAFSLDNDLVVYWKLKEGLPGSIDLVTYRPDPNSKGTFMLTFTPGDDLEPTTQGSDWVFVLDISGSMQGKFASLVEAVDRALTKMRPQDRFRIILFNDRAHEVTSGYENATRENVQHFMAELGRVSPNSGTDLYSGLIEGLQSLESDRSTGIILVTDGVANVGETRKEAFFKLLEKRDVRLFSFVMGNSANTPLLEPLARRSGGFALNVSNADDIIGRVMLASQRLTHKAYHDVEVFIDGVKVSDLTPNKIGSLYKGQQLILMGHYWQDGQAEVELRTKLSGQKKTYSTLIDFPQQSNLNPELERLWAFAKIKDLSERMEDFAGEDHKQAITEIALEYGLVTNYTSMLVLQEEQFQSYGIDRKNKKRVELENKARSTRAAQPVKSRRADTNKPAFKRSRPSFGGGGSMGWGIGVLALLVLFTRNRK